MTDFTIMKYAMTVLKIEWIMCILLKPTPLKLIFVKVLKAFAILLFHLILKSFKLKYFCNFGCCCERDLKNIQLHS